MSEQVIYVVRGTVGEYSGRTDWPVSAHHDEAAARAAVEELSAAARVKWQQLQQLEEDDFDAYCDIADGGALPQPFQIPGDPFADADRLTDSDPPTYYMEEVPVR